MTGQSIDLRLDESFCFILNWLDLQNSLCYSIEKSSNKKQNVHTRHESCASIECDAVIVSDTPDLCC